MDCTSSVTAHLQASNRKDSHQSCLLTSVQIQAADYGHGQDDDREVRRYIDCGIRAVGISAAVGHLDACALTTTSRTG
jgi:hypothetical protein